MSASIPLSATARANMSCLVAAAGRLGLSYVVHDPFGNLVSIDIAGPKYFANFATPLNRGSVERICRDKEFTYHVLKDRVRMPKTKGYLDPIPADMGSIAYRQHSDLAAIVSDIKERFGWPAVIKMNTGSLGRNVFLAGDEQGAEAALEAIFNKDSRDYDYVALAQEYVPHVREYRVIILKGEVVLLYEKDASEGVFTGNLSPLHHDRSVARHISDVHEIERFASLAHDIYSTLGVAYAGLDVVERSSGELVLIEVNAHPGFTFFVRDNGEEPLIAMYEKLLKELQRDATLHP